MLLLSGPIISGARDGLAIKIVAEANEGRDRIPVNLIARRLGGELPDDATYLFSIPDVGPEALYVYMVPDMIPMGAGLTRKDGTPVLKDKATQERPKEPVEQPEDPPAVPDDDIPVDPKDKDPKRA